MAFDKNIQHKVETVLHNRISLETLAADPDLPAILRAVQARQQALLQENETLRRQNQQLTAANTQEVLLSEDKEQYQRDELLRKISEHVPGILFQYQLLPDGQSNFPFVSGSLYHITGLKPAQVWEDASPALDLIHPDDYERVIESIQTSAATFTEWKCEFRMVTDSDTVKWLSGHSTPEAQPDGAIVWHGFFFDITQRKQAEEQWQQLNITLEKRLAELSTLGLISQAVTTVTDLTTSLKVVASLITRLLNGVGAIVFLLDSSRTQFQAVAHVNREYPDFDLTGITFPVVEAIRQQVIDKKEVLIVHNAQHNSITALHHDLFRKYNIHSLAYVPLLSRDEVTGIIVISSNRPNHHFTPTEVNLAETIAGQVAGAVEVARLFGEERHSRQVAESLREVTEVLGGSLELDTVFEAIFDQMGQVITCDSSGIFLHRGNKLMLTAAKGEAAQPHLGETVPISSQNPVTIPFHNKKWHLIEDATANFDWLDWLEQDIIYTWIGAPLLVGQRCIGVITVDSYQPHTYQPEDAEILQIFANHAALAIHNAQLHQQVQQDAQTKATLLQEIHHRVKNNFQIVSSLLQFQADYVQDSYAKLALTNSQRRIHTMALIHNQLYRTSNLANVEFDKYVEDLTDDLFSAYRPALTHPVHLRLYVENIRLPIKTALPCGLIVNELVSNALKYAFPPEWTPPAESVARITISLHSKPDAGCLLAVADNGVGLPPGKDITQGETLGMFLINAFVQQLDGEFAWQNKNPGVCFQIAFSPEEVTM